MLGLLALISSAGSGLLAVLMLASPWLASAVAPAEATTVQVDMRSAGIQAFLFFSAAAALALLGIGSLRFRRWVRPLMLVFAWTWLLTGLAVMAFLFASLDTIVAASSAEPLPPAIAMFVKTFVVSVMGVGWVLLPAIFVIGYTSKRVAETCAQHHPTPCWTDRCPTPVLGLSLGFAAGAYLAPVGALYGVVPFFGWMLGGTPALLLHIGGAAACLYLAWSTYRRRRDGWWGSLLLLTLLGISVGLTLLRVGATGMYAAFGYPEAQLEALRGIEPALNRFGLGMTAAMTAGSALYLWVLRKGFGVGLPGERPDPLIARDSRV